MTTDTALFWVHVAPGPDPRDGCSAVHQRSRSLKICGRPAAGSQALRRRPRQTGRPWAMARVGDDTNDDQTPFSASSNGSAGPGEGGWTGAGRGEDDGNTPTGGSEAAGLGAWRLSQDQRQAATGPLAGAKKKRVMVLMSDTGGGHRASAEALAAAFDDLFPGLVECQIVDFFTEIAGPPFNKFPEQYSFVAKNPNLWRAVYLYGKIPVTRRLTEEFSNLVSHGRLREAISSYNPDMIVSVHPLTQMLPLRVLHAMGIRNRVPFVTVVTDLGGAHPTWFHRDVDRIFVPSEAVRKVARRCGVDESRLREYGLPVRPSFWTENRDKASIRKQLGMQLDMPAALIVGGGDGVGGVGRVAKAVAQKMSTENGKRGAQIVVVCGRNEKLKNELESQDWPVPVLVKGFVSNMSEWMSACDTIITKAGPGTIAEALIRGLPMVLSNYLPGQEAGNVPYVTESGVGAYTRDPEAIASIVTTWFNDPSKLETMSRRAKAMGKPRATYDIANSIGDILFFSDQQPRNKTLSGPDLQVLTF